MLKQIKFAALALLLAVGFTACSDDNNDTPTRQPVRGEQGFYVVNQGNQGTIDGTISYVSFAADTVNTTDDVFFATNSQSLGDSPQKAIIYGSKMYVPVYGANTLWVLDAATLKIISKVTTNEPEAVCGSNGYVFVSNNDGYVTRIDTTAYAASTPLAVGPNPAGITAVNGKVYVSISDGYNYNNGYVNGYKVAIIDAATFTHTDDYKVGMNPSTITSDAAGNLFVVCLGNYSDVAASVWKIDASTGVISQFAEGSLIATASQERTSRAIANQSGNLLYVLNSKSDYSNWPNVTTIVTSAIYNTLTGEKISEGFIPADHTPASPTAIDINPNDGNIYVSTQATASSYTDPGYVMVYNSNGTFLKQYNTGVQPFGVVFK